VDIQYHTSSLLNAEYTVGLHTYSGPALITLPGSCRSSISKSRPNTSHSSTPDNSFNSQHRHKPDLTVPSPPPNIIPPPPRYRSTTPPTTIGVVMWRVNDLSLVLTFRNLILDQVPSPSYPRQDWWRSYHLSPGCTWNPSLMPASEKGKGRESQGRANTSIGLPLKLKVTRGRIKLGGLDSERPPSTSVVHPARDARCSTGPYLSWMEMEVWSEIRGRRLG